MNNESKQSHAIIPDLQPGETIIWEGGPGKQSSPIGKSLAAVATGLLLGMVVWATIALKPGEVPAWVPQDIFGVLSSTVVRIILAVVAVVFLMYPVIIRMVLGSVRYIVTDKRLGSYSAWLGAKSWDGYLYTEIEGVRVLPQGGSLSTLHIWPKREMEPFDYSGTQPRAFMYLPDDVAEYVSAACAGNITR